MHSVFPAALYRFQVYRESKLFDKSLGKDDWDPEDSVEVSADGLVYPKIAVDVSNGALFMPNTHFMQEVTRRSYDYYLEGLDDGKPAASPHLLCISKGTVIPDSLLLYRERDSRFLLQPSRPMSLMDLNKTLTDFYIKSGTILDPDGWLEKHPYHEAYFDDSEEWMNK